MEEKQQPKNDHNWILVLLGSLMVVAAIVLTLLFLMRGKTTTVDPGTEVTTTESVTCESTTTIYPIITGGHLISFKINAIFNNDKLDTISLTYKLRYEDAEAAKQGTANNHAAMNKSFAVDSLGPDAFDATYSTIDNTNQLSLYANAKEINAVNAKYFLLEDNSKYTKSVVTKTYNEKGFNCLTTK